MRISDWSSDVCSSDLERRQAVGGALPAPRGAPVDRFADLPAAGGLHGAIAAVELQAGRFPIQAEEADQAPGFGFRRLDQGFVPQLVDRQRQHGLPVAHEAGLQRDGVRDGVEVGREPRVERSEEHTTELKSLMSKSYPALCLKQKTR